MFCFAAFGILQTETFSGGFQADTSKLECLSKFIVFGKRHLDHLVTEFVDYYNHHRSHMERDHLPPIRELPEEVEKLQFDEIEVKSYVGGLVKAFERKAA